MTKQTEKKDGQMNSTPTQSNETTDVIPAETVTVPMTLEGAPLPVISKERLDEIASELKVGKISATSLKALADLNIYVEGLGTARVAGGYAIASQEAMLEMIRKILEYAEKNPKQLLKCAHPLALIGQTLAKLQESAKKVNAITKAHSMDDANKAMVKKRKSFAPGTIVGQQVIVNQYHNTPPPEHSAKGIAKTDGKH